MKAKLLIVCLLLLVGISSCRRQQCPAYGKVMIKTETKGQKV